MQEIIDIFRGLLTPLIGAIAVYIAYQQYKTNRLREERENRKAKLDVHKKVKLFLHDVDYSGTVPKAAYEDFRDAIAEADFLFPEDITNWLSDLYLAAAEWRNQEEGIQEYMKKMRLSKEELHKQHAYDGTWKQTWREMEGYIDELQNAHCHLKEKFAQHIQLK